MSTDSQTIRVLIVDDHAVVRQGLRTFLELQDDPAACLSRWSAKAATAPRRSTGSPVSSLISSCSTWSCPRWTASRRPPDRSDLSLGRASSS